MPDVTTQEQRGMASFESLLALQYDQPSLKRQEWYGLKLVKSMWTYIAYGNNGFFSARQKQWEENRLWSKGAKDNKEFNSMMGVEGNKSWINIDYEILKIVPRWLKGTVNRFMDRDEKPSVKATDIVSMQFKEREKIIARYRMENQIRIQQQQAAAGNGIKLEDGYTPENEDALELYYKIKFRIPEESFMENTVEQIWQNSDKENLKRECISDCAKFNLIMLKMEELPYTAGTTLSNRIRIRKVDAENSIYNIFKSPNGSDVTIAGEAYGYTISEARRKYPKVSEEKWFAIAQVARKGLNQSRPLEWQDSYVYSYVRPYDDYQIIAFDFEVKVFDKEWYVSGDWGTHPKKGRPQQLPQGASLVQGGRLNWYHGLWVVNTDIMLEWGVNDNQIRPYQNGVDSFSNYCLVYPDADGYYVPSLVERGIPIVRQMVIIGLKIQQMVSLMEPDNMSVDIHGLHQLDIGTGIKYTPIQLLRIKSITGRAYWDSMDASGMGMEGNPIPYGELPNGGNVAQLNILIGVYNFWMLRLQDEWGENDETLGRATPGKKSAAATKQAASVGGGSTEYLYDFWIMIAEQMSTKITYRLWDMLVFEGAQYKELQGTDRSLIDSTFDVNVDMIDKRAKKERQMARIQEALDSKLITMSTAEMLEEIENPKDVIMYLEAVEKKAQKIEMSKMERQIQLNAQVQQQSTQIATQGKLKEIQANAMAKVLIEQAKGNEASFKELVKMISDAESEAMKSGRELPMDLMAIKNVLLNDVLTKHQQQMGGQQGQPQDQGQPQGQGQPAIAQ
jgi:hypothetical protein